MFEFHSNHASYEDEGDYGNRPSAQNTHNKKSVPLVLFFISLGIIIAGTVLMLLLSIHFISETEEAVITCFGNPRTVSQSGPCFTIPFIEDFTTVDKTIRGMVIGYTLEEDDTIPAEATMITQDFNFLDVFFYLEWQVSDPLKYLYASQSPEIILSDLFQSSIRDTVGTYLTDEVLTTSRDEIQDAVTQSLASKLEALDVGITIHRATIQDVVLPNDDIQKAFDSVESAKTQINSKLSEANVYYTEKTAAAQATADELLQSATADKIQRINEAEAQVARFQSMYEQYLLAPEVTKLRMYYEAMEEILPNVKVIITNSKGEIVNVFTEPYSGSSVNTPSGGTTATSTATNTSSSDSNNS
ncbi:MAG: FtsH protease activity modulator HflK [Clostridia bacterium]|nr:FtsH protease activity modulator HflK [Clostridia bacterium]